MTHELPPPSAVLPRSFFERDTVTVARELLGKIIVSRVGELPTGGRIVETEAYLGADDPGSHAATRGITPRNAIMYGAPGHAYVYFTYGNHFMLNLVAEREGTAGGVLLRALEPMFGIEEMLRRRAQSRRATTRLVRESELASGPGRLARALGVELSVNGSELGVGPLTVYEAPPLSAGAVASSGRVGLSDGHELELRFFARGNPFVSKGRTGPRPPRTRPSTH